jgi:hypothetical protein
MKLPRMGAGKVGMWESFLAKKIFHIWARERVHAVGGLIFLVLRLPDLG